MQTLFDLAPAGQVLATAPVESQIPFRGETAADVTPTTPPAVEPATPTSPPAAGNDPVCGMCRRMAPDRPGASSGHCLREWGRVVTTHTPACEQANLDPELVKKLTPPPPPPPPPPPSTPAAAKRPRPAPPPPAPSLPPTPLIVVRFLDPAAAAHPQDPQGLRVCVTCGLEEQPPTWWEFGPFSQVADLVQTVAGRYFASPADPPPAAAMPPVDEEHPTPAAGGEEPAGPPPENDAADELPAADDEPAGPPPESDAADELPAAGDEDTTDTEEEA